MLTFEIKFYQTYPEGSLNNIFQDSFNKVLSQQLTHDRSYTSICQPERPVQADKDRCSSYSMINSLPNDNIFDLLKSKAFADDKINVIQTLKFALRRVENIVGKGENAGN